MNLTVYQVAPAPLGTAQWLNRILQPVIDSLRFERGAPPLELNPTGRWCRGWSLPRHMAPDGGVVLSKMMLFQSPRDIADVYVHEVAHSLLHSVPDAVPAHDTVFFALNLALRQRTDHLEGDPVFLVSAVSLYDLADLPTELNADADAGLGRCITWSFQQAKELAPTALSAEKIAVEIVLRFKAWQTELQDRPRRERLARRREVAEVARVQRLKDKLFVSNMAASVSSLFLILICVMLWSR